MRWRAKRLLGLRSVEDALVGALTVIQRTDSALRINPHFHTLALDGVYVRDEQGELSFHPLPAPSAEEVADVAAQTHARIVRVRLLGARWNSRVSCWIAWCVSMSGPVGFLTLEHAPARPAHAERRTQCSRRLRADGVLQENRPGEHAVHRDGSLRELQRRPAGTR